MRLRQSAPGGEQFRTTMDSPLPELCSVLLQPISHPPFHCQGKGLEYKSHSRESAKTLKSWITSKRVKQPLHRPKDWWRAQLLLYGLDAGKSKTTVAQLTLSLKTALEEGLQEPTQKILDLENEMNAKFRLLNAEASERKYLSLETEDSRAEFDPVKFLGERFPSKGKRKKDDLVVLNIENRYAVHAAADSMGLSTKSADAPGADDARWLVVGRDRDPVLRRASGIQAERKRWKDEQLKAKQQELDAKPRQVEVQAGPGKAALRDVVGEWRVQSPGISGQWPQVGTSFRMSIYFDTLQEVIDEDSDGDMSFDSDVDSDVTSVVVDGTELLWANFDLGLYHGVLRAKVQVSRSDLLPCKPIPFCWRGRDFSQQQIQVDYSRKFNTATLTFQSRTKLTGSLKSGLGTFKFEGNRVSTTPTHKCPEEWNEVTPGRWSREADSRWG